VVVLVLVLVAVVATSLPGAGKRSIAQANTRVVETSSADVLIHPL